MMNNQLEWRLTTLTSSKSYAYKPPIQTILSQAAHQSHAESEDDKLIPVFPFVSLSGLLGSNWRPECGQSIALFWQSVISNSATYSQSCCWLSSLASCSLQDNIPISKTKKRASYKYTEYKNSCRLYTTSGRLTNGSLGTTSTSPHWRQLPLWALRKCVQTKPYDCEWVNYILNQTQGIIYFQCWPFIKIVNTDSLVKPNPTSR